MDFTTLGAESNCNPTWNQLLHEIDNGLQGLRLISLKVIYQYLPTQLQTEDIIEDLVQDVMYKVFYFCKTTDKIIDKHPGPLISVIIRNEIFKKIPKHLPAVEHIELEPDMVVSTENIADNYEQVELIQSIRAHATAREEKVISKILRGITINHAERQALYRLRARLEKQGVGATV